MCKVIDITTPVQRRSPDLQASVRRIRSLMVKNQWGKWVPRKHEPLSSKMDLCANIDYYKIHGKLPNNVDMGKVHGKGDAYKHHRGR